MKAIGHILLAVLLGLGALTQAEETEKSPQTRETPKSPAILLQEAIYQEETEGNLDKAIELYGQVLQQAADVERLAARATYQLGMCHLKKGDEPAAADYFRKVASNYPKQTSVVKKANEQLEKIAPADSEGVLFTKLPQDVLVAIGNMYSQTCLKAGLKNLYTNSNIRYVDPDFNVYDGGYGYYTNHFDTPLTQKVRLSGTSYPNQSHYDIAGRKMNTEIVPDETRKNFYHIYWTPEEPLPPGQFYMYGWCLHGAKKSALVPDISNKDGNEKYTSTMQNRFGSHAFEVFFLVIPNDLQIAEAAEPYTDQKTVGDYTIYAWEKEVQPDENHLVTVYLSKTEPLSPIAEANAQKLNQPITVSINHSPNNDKLSVQYAVMAIIEAAGVPYQWDKSQKLAGEKARRYIEPVNFENTPANEALNSILEPVGLSCRVDTDGLYLYDPKRFQEVEIVKPSKPDKLKAEDLITEGWKLWRERKLAEAEDKFQQAVRSDPDNDGAYQGLGWAQLNQGKKQNAEASFKKCVKLNPQNSAALNGLGWIAHGQDKKPEAIQWWEKAVQAQPGATAALSGLSKTYMEMEQYDKAVKYYEMWLKAEPDNQEAKDGLEKARQAMDG